MARTTYVTLILAASLAFVLSHEEPTWEVDFELFQKKYVKVYASDEEKAFRKSVFQKNVDYIKKHNEHHEKHGFKLGMNHLGDMPHEEYVSKMLMKKVTHEERRWKRQDVTDFTKPKSENDPDTVDWRTKGAVTSVKDQGQCGSCWSFSTTGAIEGIWKLTNGSLVGLSEKNLMDCSADFGNMGCGGGIPTSAMTYVMFNGGIDTEASYPYVPESNFNCKYNANNKGAYINLYTTVLWTDEDALKSAVAIQPTSVCIDASQNSFQFYQSGVYYEPQCSEFALDHAVLAVGYGTLNGTDYWLVKNSWSATWGLNGYILMSRNKGNNCGIATDASRPLIFK